MQKLNYSREIIRNYFRYIEDENFFSPLLLVIFGFINVTLCTESNSWPDSMYSIVGLEINPAFESLFPTTSQYDNEIKTLLDDISDKFEYLSDVLQGESIEENGTKLEKAVLNGNLDKDTIKKLRKLCILGIRRNNDWLNTAVDFFLSNTR